MPRRLTRDTRRSVLGGVAAGFANYFDMDPVLARLGFVLLAFLNGVGVLFYLICWVVMPRQDAETAPAPPNVSAQAEQVVDEVRAAGERVVDEIKTSSANPGGGQIAAGIVLIVLGCLFLMDRFDWFRWSHWMHMANLWPVVVIIIGFLLILRSRKDRTDE